MVTVTFICHHVTMYYKCKADQFKTSGLRHITNSNINSAGTDLALMCMHALIPACKLPSNKALKSRNTHEHNTIAAAGLWLRHTAQQPSIHSKASPMHTAINRHEKRTVRAQNMHSCSRLPLIPVTLSQMTNPASALLHAVQFCNGQV